MTGYGVPFLMLFAHVCLDYFQRLGTGQNLSSIEIVQGGEKCGGVNFSEHFFYYNISEVMDGSKFLGYPGLDHRQGGED